MWRRLVDWEMPPRVLRRLHFWSAVLFLLMIVPSVTLWKESVPFLVAISVWANFAGHVASWQSARVEAQMEDS